MIPSLEKRTNDTAQKLWKTNVNSDKYENLKQIHMIQKFQEKKTMT